MAQREEVTHKMWGYGKLRPPRLTAGHASRPTNSRDLRRSKPSRGTVLDCPRPATTSISSYPILGKPRFVTDYSAWQRAAEQREAVPIEGIRVFGCRQSQPSVLAANCKADGIDPRKLER